VSPQSAKSGSKETFTLTYTFGDDFDEGWIEFNLPEEITATVGQDKLIIDGVEKMIDLDNISDDGKKVLLTGITAKKGDSVTMTISDKIIPESGSYFFQVIADADGEKKTKPATLGTGGEFKAFLAYSETEENTIVENFIKALNRRDSQTAIELLAENVVYVDNYMDGYFEMFESKVDVADKIDFMLRNDDGTMVNDENTLVELAENVWQVRGKTIDFSDILVAELNPDSGFDGLGYTAKFFVTDDKICYMEFLWHREDEILFDKLNEGSIGIIAVGNENGDLVIVGFIPGMPAEKAGLKPGDIIAAVNGIKVEDMDYSYSEAMYRILGEVGTKVTLTIERNGEIFDIELERESY